MVIRGISNMVVIAVVMMLSLWDESRDELGCLAMDFNFTSFNNNASLDSLNLSLKNDAYLVSDHISLTTISLADDEIQNSVGRAFHKYVIPIWRMLDNGSISLASFSTSFVFKIQNSTANNYGDGMAFLMSASPSNATNLGGSLGILNDTLNGEPGNNVVAVEFDTFQNLIFADPDSNHVGIDVNSVNSSLAKSLDLIGIRLVLDGKLKAWVDYGNDSMILSVYVALDGNPKPTSPFLLKQVELYQYLPPDIYVGFSASTGSSYESHEIFSWEFSSTPLPTLAAPAAAPAPPTGPVPVSPLEPTENGYPGGVIAGIVLAVVFALLLSFVLCFVFRCKKKAEARMRMRREFTLGDVELVKCAGPRRFSHKEIITATRNFSKDNFIGRGGFGPVYKGILPKTDTLVAVKSIGQNSKQGEKEFVAEVTIISRIRHRNLVQLQGWCHDKGQLFLVYDLMTNGSLDQHLFKKPSNEEGNIATQDEDGDKGKREGNSLDWNRRHKIVCGLAAGLLYLHEEWEMQVIHRDIKSANVMLDEDFNARLGDFGMARLVDHNMAPRTTMAVGTFGYLAPEVAETGKATSASDVYSFGAVALEVACGRPTLDYNVPPGQFRLVDWVWDLHSKGLLLEVVDPHMGDDFNKEDMERVLHLGLACSHPLPHLRPTMRQVQDCLLHGTPTPPIPTSKPMVVSSITISQPHLSISEALSQTSASTTSSETQTSTSITSSTSLLPSSSSDSLTTLPRSK